MGGCGYDWVAFKRGTVRFRGTVLCMPGRDEENVQVAEEEECRYG